MQQNGILENLSSVARYIIYRVSNESAVKEVLASLASHADGQTLVVGLGVNLLNNAVIPEMRPFPAMQAGDIEIPSSEGDLWCWLRGANRDDLIHQDRELSRLLAPAFEVLTVTDAFVYGENQDLTGYIDGTENPVGENAHKAALSQKAPIIGSSFVAVQLWQHDFDIFDQMSEREQDESIGRYKRDNEEFDAPESAHVKRTAQEDFEPEAFVLRRSMPWSDGKREGLNFIAFGASFDAFEAQMHRMSGNEDGIRDAIFKFTRPLSGHYFWCPPMNEEGLDLRAMNQDIHL